MLMGDSFSTMLADYNEIERYLRTMRCLFWALLACVCVLFGLSVFQAPEIFQRSSHGRFAVARDAGPPMFGRLFESLNGFMEPDIDAVITYVNGSRPNFQLGLAKALAELPKGRIPQESATPNRYADNGDLKILLRSLADQTKFRFRHIHVVVADEDQVPEWLNTSHRNLKIVFHRDIWRDPAQLPVFNSLAIEANLHHIPGLSEIFIYFNDDTMPLKPIGREQFVFLRPIYGTIWAIKARSSLHLEETYQAPDDQKHWLGGAAYTQNILRSICPKNIKQTVERSFGFVPTHAPHLMLRSVLYHAEYRIPDLFFKASGSKIRSGNDINPVMLFNGYAQCQFNYALFWGSTSRIMYVSLNASSPGINDTNLEQRLTSLGNRVANSEFLCINDASDGSNQSSDAGETYAHQVYAWRESLFPEPSVFELQLQK